MNTHKRLATGSFGEKRNCSQVLLVLMVGALVGCSSTPAPSETSDARTIAQARSNTMDLNEKLASLAAMSAVSNDLLRREYGVGAGDILDVAVFNVEELNTKVRVSRAGTILMPLLGELEVAGKSVREIEELIEKRLTEFMHDPDVAIFVAEYNSQQVSVNGAVNDPALHTLTRPRTVMELLSMSGGLTEDAGKQIYVRTVIDGESRRVIMDLDQVLRNAHDEDHRILVSGGDSIFVPQAGTVFVEGAVNKPGAYPLKGNTGVVEAIAMAGGAKFEAQEDKIRIVTITTTGDREIVFLNLDEVRANETPSVALSDGDIVLVPTSKVKAGWAGFWRGFSGIFGVGYGL